MHHVHTQPEPPPPTHTFKLTYTHAYTYTLYVVYDNTQPSAASGTQEYLDTYRSEWREVFIVSAELYAFGSIVYLILGSGKKQYWADSTLRNSANVHGNTVIIKQNIQVEIDIPHSEKTKLIDTASIS